MKFIEMPKELQTKSIETLSLNYGMPEQIIEKDWWVSTVMRVHFSLCRMQIRCHKRAVPASQSAGM